MQILVAEHLHKCMLFLYGSMARLEQIARLLYSQRVEGTTSGERARSIDPQAPGKSQTIIVQKSLWSQKHHDSIRCGMSYASNTCVLEQQRRICHGPSALFSSITSATLRT